MPAGATFTYSPGKIVAPPAGTRQGERTFQVNVGGRPIGDTGVVFGCRDGSFAGLVTPARALRGADTLLTVTGAGQLRDGDRWKYLLDGELSRSLLKSLK